MKKLLLSFFLLYVVVIITYAQTPADTSTTTQEDAAADDPSQFFTRAELFNETQHHNNNGTNFYLNATTLRTVVKIGKRFTTRLDVPFVYNSLSTAADYQQFGLSDISFRLLGFKFLQSRKSAVTASIEISLNTAQSPLLGTGKDIILPVVSYTTTLSDKKTYLAFVFQEAISFAGNETREDISFSKLQGILINVWTRKMWTVFAPELFVDYIHGGASMNLEGRIVYAPTRRINLWTQLGVGAFGDYIARYQWSAQVGGRYFLLRTTKLEHKSSE